jgi:KDO2-lipid IV(A) lauroyltransferase
VKETARAVYRHLGFSLAETLKMSRIDKAWVGKNVRLQGMDRIKKILDSGKGIISLVSHFGCWELQGAAWSVAGWPLAVVAFPQSNKQVDALILKNRTSTGMEIIYTGHHGTVRALRVLREGGVVGLLADQNAGKDGLRLPFFGRDCSVTKAPAVLARKTGAVMIPMFMVREKDGTFTNHVLPEVKVDKTENLEKDIEVTTRRFLKVQEDFIREHPSQYFWVHRRWKHYEKT